MLELTDAEKSFIIKTVNICMLSSFIVNYDEGDDEPVLNAERESEQLAGEVQEMLQNEELDYKILIVKLSSK